MAPSRSNPVDQILDRVIDGFRGAIAVGPRAPHRRLTDEEAAGLWFVRDLPALRGHAEPDHHVARGLGVPGQSRAPVASRTSACARSAMSSSEGVLANIDDALLDYWFMRAQLTSGNARVVSEEQLSSSSSAMHRILEADGGHRWERPDGSFTRVEPREP